MHNRITAIINDKSRDAWHIRYTHVTYNRRICVTDI